MFFSQNVKFLWDFVSSRIVKCIFVLLTVWQLIVFKKFKMNKHSKLSAVTEWKQLPSAPPKPTL